MDRFILQGVTYYQQKRKCGRPACRCQSGEPHGPYWYARDLSTGKVTYLGRDLPEAITDTHAAHARLFAAMRAKKRELSRQVQALSRLMSMEPLTQDDVALLTSLGFRACLVPEMADRDRAEHKIEVDPNDPKAYAQSLLV